MKTGILIFDVDFNVPESKNLNLSAQESTLLFKSLCKSMMKDAAISTNEKFTKADIDRFTVTGFQKGYDRTSAGLSYVEGWAPEEGKTNKRLKYVTKILNGDEKKARKLLETVWEYMNRYHFISLKPFGRRKAYLLDYRKIKTKTISKLYICSECRGITPYNIKGVCDNPKCNGHLEEYDFKVALQNDHYYNLYTNLDITAMKVREHTAQLSPCL